MTRSVKFCKALDFNMLGLILSNDCRGVGAVRAGPRSWRVTQKKRGLGGRAGFLP
jgi:hypothetical protein